MYYSVFCCERGWFCFDAKEFLIEILFSTQSYAFSFEHTYTQHTHVFAVSFILLLLPSNVSENTENAQSEFVRNNFFLLYRYCCNIANVPCELCKLGVQWSRKHIESLYENVDLDRIDLAFRLMKTTNKHPTRNKYLRNAFALNCWILC